MNAFNFIFKPPVSRNILNRLLCLVNFTIWRSFVISDSAVIFVGQCLYLFVVVFPCVFGAVNTVSCSFALQFYVWGSMRPGMKERASREDLLLSCD